MENETSEFLPRSEGNNEQEGQEMHHNTLFVFPMHCLLSLMPLYIQFGIDFGFVIPKEEFGKDKLHRGMEFISQNWIWKIWLICEFFLFQVEERTHDWKNSAKIMAGHLILSLRICDMSLSGGHVQDISRTFPTKLSSAPLSQPVHLDTWPGKSPTAPPWFGILSLCPAHVLHHHH